MRLPRTPSRKKILARKVPKGDVEMKEAKA